MLSVFKFFLGLCSNVELVLACNAVGSHALTSEEESPFTWKGSEWCYIDTIQCRAVPLKPKECSNFSNIDYGDFIKCCMASPDPVMSVTWESTRWFQWWTWQFWFSRTNGNQVPQCQAVTTGSTRGYQARDIHQCPAAGHFVRYPFLKEIVTLAYIHRSQVCIWV